MTLSEYEEERNRNIAKNQAMLHELGLIDTPMLCTTPTPRVKIKSVLKRPSPTTQRATHSRVLRQRADPVPAKEEEEGILVTESRTKAHHRARKEQLHLDEELGELPIDIQDNEDDGDVAPQCGGCAYVKHMLPSHVTGGYWLQAPAGLCAVMPQATCDIRLRVGNAQWELTYLMRPSGAGLSGGWRGFAVDQRLCIGDSVVFQQRSTDK